MATRKAMTTMMTIKTNDNNGKNNSSDGWDANNDDYDEDKKLIKTQPFLYLYI